MDAVGGRPPHHYKTTTITAAPRATGLIARTVFDGATDGMSLRAYVTDILAPVLRPGDTVILDNLNAHKVAEVREAIEAVGAGVLYLPPYSPTSIRVWMAPAGQGCRIGSGELVGCGHVYGV